MKLLHFDQDNNRIIVNTYSPYLDDYNFYDPQNFPGKDEMIINLDLSVDKKQVATDYFAVNVYTDAKIGEQDKVASGNTAETVLGGLTENNVYSWYAVAEDTYTGKAISEIWSFTKGKVEQPNIPDPSDDNENPVLGDSEKPSTNEGVQPTEPKATGNANNGGSQTPNPGKWIPNTATNSYNLLLSGLLLLIAGGAMLIVRRGFIAARSK
jgi:LPXTG-motif cell wall-anchored protein